LDVFNNELDDPKSLIIAAKAGYDEVINMLFGFSVTNPDPDPLDDMPADSATPILAAIGRESMFSIFSQCCITSTSKPPSSKNPE
jgi:hypothetical protein